MRRELAIAFGAGLTWWIAALAAFVVGHSFVLAVDLYAAASRSVGVGMMARGLEPLLGIIRPTLGGASFCLTVLGPVLAVRSLAIERERRSLHSLLLNEGSASRVLVTKFAATWLALTMLIVPALASSATWLVVGGHLHAGETLVAVLGALLQVSVLAALGMAAAAWTRGLAAAIAVAMVLSSMSWVVDGVSEFAALSWLAFLERWSLSPHLDGMQRGFLVWGDVLWLLGLCGIALVIAWVGLRHDQSRRWRAAVIGVVTLVGVAALWSLDRVDGGLDLSEARRGSLPKATTAALRGIEAPIAIEVWLDRDDGRRAHVESDALFRLRMAIPGLRVRFPLDRGEQLAAAIRDEDYGLTVVRVGETALSTRSTARRELSTLILEAADKPVPVWNEEPYPGYPLVISPAQRRAIMAGAYVVLPLLLGLIGWRRRSATGGTPR